MPKEALLLQAVHLIQQAAFRGEMTGIFVCMVGKDLGTPGKESGDSFHLIVSQPEDQARLVEYAKQVLHEK